MLGKTLGAAAAAVSAGALVDLGAQPAGASNGSAVTAGNITAERRASVV